MGAEAGGDVCVGVVVLKPGDVMRVEYTPGVGLHALDGQFRRVALPESTRKQQYWTLTSPHGEAVVPGFYSHGSAWASGLDHDPVIVHPAWEGELVVRRRSRWAPWSKIDLTVPGDPAMDFVLTLSGPPIFLLRRWSLRKKVDDGLEEIGWAPLHTWNVRVMQPTQSLTHEFLLFVVVAFELKLGLSWFSELI